MILATEHELTYELDPLLRQAIDNDRQALDAVFARHRDQLYGRALVLLGNPEDAEDALQEGLLSALRHLHQFKGRSKLSTWLTRIVVNAALMQLRRRRPGLMASMDDSMVESGQDRASTFPDPRLNPEEAYAQRERQQVVGRGVRKLTARYRRALWLRDIQGLTTREAAGALGVSEGTLKSQLSRARLKLKQEISDSLANTSILQNRRGLPVPRRRAHSQFAERVVRPAA